MKKNYFNFMGFCIKTLTLLSLFYFFTAFSTTDSEKPKKKVILSSSYYDPASYMALTLSGLNADVIANGVGSLNTTTDNDVDGVNFCYLSQGTQITSGSTPIAYGLPTNGILPIANSDLYFNLAPYDSNNSLRIATNGAAGLSAVDFAENESFETLSLAVTSGSGASSVTITVTFTDATTQIFNTVNIPDWFNSNALPTVISGIGRGSRADNGLENPANNPRIYRLDLAIDPANQTKLISGITVQKISGGVFNLFAVSGKLVPDCPGPTNITSTTVNAFDATISWTAANANDTFEVALVPTGAAIPSTGDASATNSFSFSTLTPETTYDAYVRTVCPTSGFSFWTGPFTFTTTVACVAPTGIVFSSIDTNSATVAWSGGSGTDWEFAYVTAGSPAPTSGTPLTTATTGLSMLTQNTSYTVYVRANCGPNGYSAWTIATFTTACSTSISINEDFEGTATGSIPNCWSLINGGDVNTWAVQNNFPAYPRSGSKFARIAYSATAHNDFLITPPFTVTANVSDIISFWARNYSTTYIDRFNVLVSTSGNQETDFTEVLATNVGPSTTYTEYTYDLSAYVGQTIYFAIQAISTDQYYLFIDDLMTSGVPLCDAPVNLTASDVSEIDAILSWDAGTATEWEIVVQNLGDGVPTSGTVVNTNSYYTAYPIGTVSEFYVRSVCPNSTGYSPWAGPFVFGGYVDLEIASGLTDDVIANGVGPAANSTTNDIDGGNYVYLSRDYKLNGTDADLTFGLPVNGLIASPNVPGLIFKMNPLNTPYDGNNSLRIATSGAANGGTLSFNTIYPAEKIYFLVTSGGGSSTVSGMIHFDDGSSQAISATLIPDWFNQTSLPVAISGIGRINTTNNVLENPNNNPRIYELAIDVDPANQDKTFSSIDFQKDSGTGVVNIFAASIKFATSSLGTDGFVLKNDVKWYPNPVSSILNLEFNKEVSKVQILNLVGQILIDKVITNESTTQIDVSSLTSGTYIVNVTMEGKVESIKVIKN